jgi:bifunctional ADP-heptose synthase (sugar kinase/adenylyltransferase)
VKGADYKPEDIVGYDVVKNKGGDVITIDLTEGYSTTSIIEKSRE